MRNNKYGRIINMGAGSANYLTGNFGYAPFGIMKGSLILFTKELAVEEIKNGITVNMIGPGSTKDAGTNPEENRIPVSDLPLGRRIFIDEIIRTVNFFVDPENSSTTGQVINVCGGYHV